MTKSKENCAEGFDLLVGHNLRVVRKKKGVSLVTLGEAITLSYQQLQKYENGTNRISAGRLYQVACCLGVPVEVFFTGAENLEEYVRIERLENEPQTYFASYRTYAGTTRRENLEAEIEEVLNIGNNHLG
ncbi:helix-turn-helix transcriptional regulator [Pseudovibrio sp. Tun.PSC04-5.I4]|uniref:helix-turn-helix domain-containing protein n=1 Tax=Pseudovibrio sp. Tun.PSC04-5.I4 TaxID=1798213 RepID=UPI0008838BA6|nr:helix-turn-helix transcriptional regulator [Pseudovibrio sp. Tun.PSC04-5.I4]SDQ37064.1 Helix-turn-helix [Pseudovibrio sp. Tun.PSC04-5.I4]